LVTAEIMATTTTATTERWAKGEERVVPARFIFEAGGRPA
jgi:hypothetical protein